jgi:hypothetical protein
MIIGAGSFVLPLIGLQFRVVDIFGPAAPIIGGLLAVVGLILFTLSYRSANSGSSVGAVGMEQADAGAVTTTEPTIPITATQTSTASSSEECRECLLNPIDTCNMCNIQFCAKHGGRRGSRKMCIQCYKSKVKPFGYISTAIFGILGLPLLILFFCTGESVLLLLATVLLAGAGLVGWLTLVFSNPARW